MVSVEKGSSSTRGKAITNERKAVAYAHCNINGGPAHGNTGTVTDYNEQLRGSH